MTSHSTKRQWPVLLIVSLHLFPGICLTGDTTMISSGFIQPELHGF